jgi:hypothetical protein
MRGRQINFFVMPDEWQALEDYISENNMISVSTRMSTKEIEQSNICEGTLFKYFVDKKYKDKLKTYYLKETGLYYIAETFSPVIKFYRSYYDIEKNLLKRGKFYYTKGFWNDNGEWQEKPADFMQTADKLFKWFRKTYKNVKLPEYKGFLITQNVKEKMENEDLKLKEF